MGNKNRNRVKKSISPFVKWGKWGGDGVKAFVYAIIFTIVGSDGASYIGCKWTYLFGFKGTSCAALAFCTAFGVGSRILWGYGRLWNGVSQGSYYACRCHFGGMAWQVL